MTPIHHCPRCAAETPTSGIRQSNVTRCLGCGSELHLRAARRKGAILPVGKRFAHYHVEEQLGDGTVTSVYRVRNLRLKRNAVLRVLAPDIAADAPHLADRFISIARSGASLEHHNILPIYFVGRADGRVFFESQYADGGTLRFALSRKGKLDPIPATRVIRAVARGLHAAHMRDVLHGDLRPGRVMLLRQGAIRLADFGLSTVECAMVTDLPITRLHYLAPECFDQDGIDQRADIYALGATFFELLTGHPLFDAPSRASLLQLLAQKTVPSPREYGAPAPDALCHILRRMTAHDMAHRYPDCAELLRDLDAFLAESKQGSSRISLPRWPKVRQPSETQRALAPPIDALGGPPALIAGGDLKHAVSTEDAELSPDASDKVVAHMVLEDLHSPAGAFPSARILQAQSSEMLRQARAKRFRARLASLIRLTLVLALLGGMTYAAGVGVRRVRTAARERKQRREEEQRRQTAERFATTGQDLERRGNWRDAAKDYRNSLALRNDPTIRERLDVVQKITQGLALEDEQKWASAEEALVDILPKTFSKALVSKHLKRVRLGLAYEGAYAKGKTADSEKDWSAAVAHLTRAADLARELRIETDAQALASAARAKIAEEADRRARMEWLLATSKKKRNLAAYAAACEYYMRSPDHAPHREDLQARLEEVQVAQGVAAKQARIVPMSEEDDLHDLMLNNGTVLRGKLISQTPDGIVLNTTTNGKTQRRLFHPSDVQVVEPVIPVDVNKHRAESLYSALMRAAAESRPFDALRMVGELKMNFADTPIVQSVEEQRRKFDRTLDDMLAKIVPRCEVMCEECEGAASLICQLCKGTATRRVRCKTCENLAWLPVCKKCQGTGMLYIGKCKVCGGAGKRTCKRCGGRSCSTCGMRGTWRCGACNATGRAFLTRDCYRCNGTGKVDGETCSKCYGRGRPPCPECKGTGRQTCPDCNNERYVEIPCERCSRKGRIPCRTCRHTGTRLPD